MRRAEESNFNVLTAPYDPREGMTLRQAAQRAGKSETTIKNWAIKWGLGRRVGGGLWVISRPALEMFLDGNDAALRDYHRSNWTEAVREYFGRTGVPFRKSQACPARPEKTPKSTYSTISVKSAV